MKIKLTKPIEAQGETLTELTIREPEFGDLMEMDKVDGELAKFGKLIEVLAEIPSSSVRKLSTKDVRSITQALGPFVKDFEEIGAK